MVFTAASATVKSTRTSTLFLFKTSASFWAPFTGTPIFPAHITSPTSFPSSVVFGDPIAATTSISSSLTMALIILEPILPLTPVTATLIISSISS